MEEFNMTLIGYEVEFIPLERRLNERRSHAMEMMVKYGLNITIVERRGVPDRRPQPVCKEAYR